MNSMTVQQLTYYNLCFYILIWISKLKIVKKINIVNEKILCYYISLMTLKSCLFSKIFLVILKRKYNIIFFVKRIKIWIIYSEFLCLFSSHFTYRIIGLQTLILIEHFFKLFKVSYTRNITVKNNLALENLS